MFRTGDTVIFEPSNLNQDYWNGLSDEEKTRYYGRYVHLSKSITKGITINGMKRKGKLFTFITTHYPQLGHCVLMDMSTGELLPMCHDSDFRLVTDEEC